MYSIKIHKRINQITTLFYRYGLRNSGQEVTVRETRFKLFYSFYFMMFPISLITGAFSSENRDEFVFLVEAAIMTTVSFVKLLYIIWKKKQILGLLNRICVYSFENSEKFNPIKDKLKNFIKFVTILLSFIYLCVVCGVLVVPFIGADKKLFFNIGFPIDYNNSDVAYCIAFTFFTTEGFLTSIIFLFSVLMWYLMFNCALRYEVLGNQIENMGVFRTVEEASCKVRIRDNEKQNSFRRDFKAAIESHKHLIEYEFFKNDRVAKYTHFLF